MDDDVTEPIPAVAPLAERIRGQLSPSRVVAGVSTTVAVAAVTALVLGLGQQPQDTPAEAASPVVASGPADHTQPVAARPAPSPAPEAAPPSAEASAPPASAAPAADSAGGLGDILKPPNSTPIASAGPVGSGAVPVGSLPRFDAPSLPAWQTPNLTIPPLNAIPSGDAVINSVSDTAGWVGGGALDVLGDVIIASSYSRQGGGITQPNTLAALMLGPAATGRAGVPSLPGPPQLDFSRLPAPQLDLSKLPSPQLDLSKLPPPQVDLSKLPPPQLPPPPRLPKADDPFAKLPSITRAVGLPF